MVADTPVEVPSGDFFDYDVYAKALAELIDSEGTDTPLTLAVSAPWGAGKTSVANMIESYLQEWNEQRDGLRTTITCSFPAWMHNDAPHLGAAMAAAVVNQTNRHRPLWRRLWRPIPSAMLDPRERWKRRVKIGLVTLAIAGVAFLVEPVRELFDPLSEDFSAALSTGSIVAVIGVFAATWNRVRSAADSTLAFIDDPASEAARGTMSEVRAHLSDHIKEATRRDGRLVVFVDDLERCSPARAMEACEVANQLLDLRNVVTVFVADMRAIAAAAAKEYAEGGDGEDAEATEEAGRRYLEKIVQIELSLPPPSPEGIVRLLKDERAERDAEEVAETETTTSRQIVRVISEQPIASIVGFVVGVLIMAQLIISSELEDDLGLLLYTVVVTLPGVVGLTTMLSAYSVRAIRREHARNQRMHINEHIDQLRKQGVQQDDLEEEVVKEFPGHREELARDLVRSYLFENPEQLDEVEEIICAYPPALPRRAKRMLNQARLLTRIARDRNLFVDEPPLAPKQLGEWIVLQDRWPKLAEAVTKDPDLLAGLEFTAGQGEDAITAALTNANIGAQSVGDLTRLLREDPRLTDVIERLVHFEPVAPPVPLPLSARVNAQRQAALRAAVGVSESQASVSQTPPSL